MGIGVKILKRFLLGMLPVLAGIATAATFNLFQPATGILKGNASTYVTTAAVSSDIIGTFTGTCNNGTYLRGDGTCNTPPGTGVSSVGLTMPTGFSVGGSPVTSSGTLAVTTTLSGVVHGNGSGFTASNVLLGSEVSGTLPVGNGGSGATSLTGVLHGNGTSAFTAAAVNLTSEVTGTLPVANGGTGAATLTGLLRGNGTSAFTAATSANVISLWSGSCSSSTFLRGDGSCASAGTSFPLRGPDGTSGAPTYSFTSSTGSGMWYDGVGAALVDPSIVTIDAPQIEMDASTGVFTGGATGGPKGAGTINATGLYINGVAVGGGSGTVTSVALTMPSGFSVGGSPVTTSGTLAVTTALNGPLRGNGSGFTTGSIALGSEVSGTLPVGNGGTGVTSSTGSGSVVLSASPTLSGTITGGTFSGTFSGNGASITSLNASNISSGTVPTANLETTGTTTCNLSGMTATTTTTIRYTVVGDIASLRFGLALGTSNSTGMSCPSGTIPSAARPNGGSGSQIATIIVTDNGNLVVASARVVNDGSINFGRITPGAGFTASGSKGFSEDAAFTYTIN